MEIRSKQRDTLDKGARIASINFYFHLYYSFYISFLFLFLFFFDMVESFWHDVNNRRELFERFASSKGADAMDSAFWYALKLSEVLKFKVTKGETAEWGEMAGGTRDEERCRNNIHSGHEKCFVLQEEVRREEKVQILYGISHSPVPGGLLG